MAEHADRSTRRVRRSGRVRRLTLAAVAMPFLMVGFAAPANAAEVAPVIYELGDVVAVVDSAVADTTAPLGEALGALL